MKNEKTPTARKIFVQKVAPVIIASAVTAATAYAYFHRTIVLDLTEDSVDKLRDGLSARYDTPRNGTIFVHMREHLD